MSEKAGTDMMNQLRWLYVCRVLGNRYRWTEEFRLAYEQIAVKEPQDSKASLHLLRVQRKNERPFRPPRPINAYREARGSLTLALPYTSTSPNELCNCGMHTVFSD